MEIVVRNPRGISRNAGVPGLRLRRHRAFPRAPATVGPNIDSRFVCETPGQYVIINNVVTQSLERSARRPRKQ